MDELIFKNKKRVFEYLLMEGWKVSNGTFYKHCKQDKLVKRDGVYWQSDVDKYAEKYLENPITGEKGSIAEYKREALRKLKADRRRSEAKAKREEHDLAVEQKKYIPRKDLDIEFASRAAVFSNALRGMYKKRAIELVEMVGGDKSKALDLANALSDHMEDALNDLADANKFEVVFLKNNNQ